MRRVNARLGGEADGGNISSIRLEEGRDLSQQRRSGLNGRRPKDVEIDVEIGVTQAVTHPDQVVHGTSGRRPRVSALTLPAASPTFCSA